MMTRSNRKCQHGVAAIEFAILLLPMLLIAFGITEFGRAFYQYNTLAKATRNAARYLSQQNAGDAQVATNARCLLQYGSYDWCVNGNGSQPVSLLPAADFSQATITICDWQSTAPACAGHKVVSPAANLVSVSVDGYPFRSLVPFATGGQSLIRFGKIATTMRSNL